MIETICSIILKKVMLNLYLKKYFKGWLLVICLKDTYFLSSKCNHICVQDR